MSTLLTPIGRISFPSLVNPTAYDENQEAKYQFVLLIPKTADLGPLKQAIKDCLKEKFGEKKPPATLRLPIRDGDEETRDDGTPKHEGCWFLRLASKQPVPIVDAKKVSLEADDRRVYAGANCRAAVNAYYYDNKSKGVNFGLQAIQMTGGGDPFGAGPVNTDDVFPEVEGADDIDSVDDLLG